MQKTVRTFVAVEISTEVRAGAGRLIGRLEATGAGVRWVKPEHLHLTLKFLGEVDLRDVPEVCAVVTQATTTVPPFSVRVAGAGAFPDFSRPRTVWLGVEDETGELAALHEQIDKALGGIGFRREQRRFRPHLTIGRVRSGGRGLAALAEALEKNRDFAAGVVDVDEVVVFSSELERGGPIHEPLATAELAGQ
ncbi:MAG: RNA 2',3'-cyclic phosphodiesterase [Planctomycetia bacterium]|nr:RNA 2',3'-cyclic phosphodiesterase [Planctomycetia bacterium]